MRTRRIRLTDGAADGPPSPVPELPLGLTVRELDRGFIGRLEMPESVQGVIVSRVDPTGAAFSALLRRGFIIMEINRNRFAPSPTTSASCRRPAPATSSRSTSTIRRSPSARS